jgi:hypothetical protein
MLIACLARHTVSRIGDRALDRMISTLSMATGLSVLLFFALALMLAPARAASDAAACGGDNLAAEISDAAVKAKIDGEAAAVANGSGLLWRVEKEGVAPSFLFGTMHVTDPRVLALTPPAQTAFEGASSLVIETTEVLDPVKAQAAMLKRPDLMMFTDGGSLDALIPAEDLPMVEKGMSARGMPLASVRLMKPWMVASLMAIPACELNRKNGGVEILDIDLARRAAAAGKGVEGLETIEEQVSAMASLPMEDHVRGLVEMVRLADRMDDVFETMLSLYAEGEISRIMPTLNAALGMAGDEESIAAYAAFEEKMINARNRTMAERLPPHLAAGGAFVAVGALHLPGENGLVEELRRAGYTVTRAD